METSSCFGWGSQLFEAYAEDLQRTYHDWDMRQMQCKRTAAVLNRRRRVSVENAFAAALNRRRKGNEQQLPFSEEERRTKNHFLLLFWSEGRRETLKRTVYSLCWTEGEREAFFRQIIESLSFAVLIWRKKGKSKTNCIFTVLDWRRKGSVLSPNHRITFFCCSDLKEEGKV